MSEEIEQFRVVTADGRPRTHEKSTRTECGSLSEWDEDFIGGPHRYQKRKLVPTEWEDIDE